MKKLILGLILLLGLTVGSPEKFVFGEDTVQEPILELSFKTEDRNTSLTISKTENSILSLGMGAMFLVVVTVIYGLNIATTEKPDYIRKKD